MLFVTRPRVSFPCVRASKTSCCQSFLAALQSCNWIGNATSPYLSSKFPIVFPKMDEPAHYLSFQGRPHCSMGECGLVGLACHNFCRTLLPRTDPEFWKGGIWCLRHSWFVSGHRMTLLQPPRLCWPPLPLLQKAVPHLPSPACLPKAVALPNWTLHLTGPQTPHSVGFDNCIVKVSG